jgi:hypothetical protein
MTPRIHFVSFSTPSFRPRQWLLERSAINPGKADVIHTWNPTRLDQDGFTRRHADLFPQSKGFGWYAWKPHIIHRTLASANDGESCAFIAIASQLRLTVPEKASISNPLLNRLHRSLCLT